ncbi:MAG: ATP-binding protein [Corynebacteriales bacterium]|nr:ATP-binding protein [Mycobacteriales bacterium]
MQPTKGQHAVVYPRVALDLRGVTEPTRHVRHWARSVLATWRVAPEAVDDVVLILSELVTNAALHAGRALRAVLIRQPGDICIEVVDNSIRAPQLRMMNPGEESGRGLYLVQQLGRQWGSRLVSPDEYTGAAKVVWCIITAPAQ